MMISDYFDCNICGDADEQSPLPDCAVCRDAECDSCVDETGKCVPCT